VVPQGGSRDAALDLAQRLAALPPRSVRETKALLNHAVRSAVEALLATALATETAEFDTPELQANLAGMLARQSGQGAPRS